ncbi:MAG: hypothetical protein WDA26_00115 [Pusillimonas sp.]
MIRSDYPLTITKPITITDAILTSSTVAADTTPLWSAATNYTAAQVVRRPNHHLYESVAGGTDSTPPEQATGGETPKWVDLGPVNKWRMFDPRPGTLTTDTDEIEVVLTPGTSIGALGALELYGVQRIEVTMTAGGIDVYHREIGLSASTLASIFDWFFTDAVLETETVLMDLPQQWPAATLTVKFSGSGTIGVGMLIIGRPFEVGGAEWGVSATIDDWSLKLRDERFGTVEFIKGEYSKRVKLRTILEPGRFNLVYRQLAGFRATPCLISPASSLQQFSGLVIFGVLSFDVDVAYPTLYYCSMEIEGLV